MLDPDMVAPDRQRDCIHTRHLLDSPSQCPADGEHPPCVRNGRAEVGSPVGMLIGPRVHVITVEGEEERQPGLPREAPRRQARDGVVTVNDMGIVPMAPRSPNGRCDRAIGKSPARLTGNVEVPRTQHEYAVVAHDAGRLGVELPSRSQPSEWPGRDRSRGDDGDRESKPCECPCLCLEEDTPDWIAVPGIPTGNPHHLAHVTALCATSSSRSSQHGIPLAVELIDEPPGRCH